MHRKSRAGDGHAGRPNRHVGPIHPNGGPYTNFDPGPIGNRNRSPHSYHVGGRDRIC